ncbi:MAG: hypothetical protein J5I50_10070 [Chitinophagaceae bacterium]|nr:hypothetical protein [Chitinophagaceae bacterium]
MKIFLLPLLALTLFCASCKSSKTTDTGKPANTSAHPNKVLIGFNQNWRFLPSLDNKVLLENIKELQAQIIRYPGGTITHGWNWRTGKFNKQGKNDYSHPIEDLKKLVDATGAEVVFDLDVVNSSVSDQIEMLQKARTLGIDIKYLELGNELYSMNHGYEIKFPDGKAYADTVNEWVPKLRRAFPEAKIAALHIGKTSKISRQSTWNQQTTKGIIDIDAFTYHIYISKPNTFEERIANFKRAYYNPDKKPLWITEYGCLTDPDGEYYLSDLRKLADFVENLPGTTMILNHTIIGVNLKHSKLNPSDGGTSFTAEGKMYLDRVKPKH